MSIIGTIYEDVTTDVLGEIGSWQWMVVLVSTLLMLPSFFIHHEDIFLLQPKEVNCIPMPAYEIVNISLCSFTISNGTDIECSKWQIKLMWMVWLKKSWLVFCDYRARLVSTAMVCRMGMVFGCIIMGLVADSFGRKKALLVDIVAATVWRLLHIFCDSEGWYRLLVFLRAVFGSAGRYMGLILVCEVSSNRWRSRLMAVVLSPRLIAMICMVPLADCIPNSETYSFIGCLCGLMLILILFRWTPESPHWLLFNRKIYVAEKVLYKAAIRNGVEFSAEFKIRAVNHRAYNILDEATSCLGVVTTHNIRVLVLMSFLFWGLYGFLWSSIYLRVYSDEDTSITDVLLKVFCFFFVLSGAAVFLSEKLKLKYLLSISVVLTGVFKEAEVLMYILKYQEPVSNLLASLALASGLLVHAILIIITPRLFAVNVRATLFGICHATGQLGSMVGYLLNIYKVTGELAFLAVEMCVMLALAVLCLMYPDVDRRELPDTMEDMDYFSELSKPLRWATQKLRSPSKEEVQIKVHSFNSQNVRSRSNSPERPPAMPIGLARLWSSCKQCCPFKLFIRK